MCTPPSPHASSRGSPWSWPSSNGPFYRCYALTDIVREVHPFIFRMGLPPRVKLALVEGLAETEYRLASGTSERLQLGGLVGAFVKAREEVIRAASA